VCVCVDRCTTWNYPECMYAHSRRVVRTDPSHCFVLVLSVARVRKAFHAIGSPPMLPIARARESTPRVTVCDSRNTCVVGTASPLNEQRSGCSTRGTTLSSCMDCACVARGQSEVLRLAKRSETKSTALLTSHSTGLQLQCACKGFCLLCVVLRTATTTGVVAGVNVSCLTVYDAQCLQHGTLRCWNTLRESLVETANHFRFVNFQVQDPGIT